ncbi:MAG TPA: bifunctional riboflavin kinase/FAD synthetase [Candidatus Sulfotelmatobacter sp.]|jgi:riboflavin kinase/FMN adenylyltransferase|nr:bifunctional riboflavin kinase/FAD synthetase [Candidatus Sulfotelmatobacter sp.]
MRLFRHYTELPADVRGGVVALGNFDGVHLGHQAVIGRAQALAREQSLACGVMSFEPHPRSVFKPDRPPFRLTPFRVKARLIEGMGLDFLVMQHFDLAFASHTAEDFVDQALVGGLGVRHVVVGYDYEFGKGRSGHGELLKQMAARRGFEATLVEPISADGGAVYSSTAIRHALSEGRAEDAAAILGRFWEIEGRVEHGDARGRTIGFPTANVEMADYLHPARGVYAVFAGIDQAGRTEWRPGVANFGSRPTFDKDGHLLEVHLFDFDGDLYGRHLRVALVSHLRDERKFDSLEALKNQIVEDSQNARRILAARRGP